MSIFFGCVADDFTGASDGASFLVKAGVSTILVNGIPEDDMPEISSEAVVIALKSRTQNTEEAVADCIKAFQWLIKKGAKVLYFKYCSTFDSTDDGNIGPVIDAVLEKFNYPYTVLCPSLPVNGRTVKNGKLYVYGKLLEESSMKDHPITPMRHSRLSDLMKKQGKYRCLETSLPVTEEFFVDIKKEIDLSGHCYLVPDYENDKQGAEIVNTFPEIGFYTGGSGLMEHLAKKYVMDNGEREKSKIFFKSPGKACILAGSCSEATLSQIEYFQKAGLPTYKILIRKTN